MLAGGTIHANIARQLLELILDQDEDPEILLEREGLTGSNDNAELAAIRGRFAKKFGLIKKDAFAWVVDFPLFEADDEDEEEDDD